jgi:hypothetical protein
MTARKKAARAAVAVAKGGVTVVRIVIAIPSANRRVNEAWIRGGSSSGEKKK